MAVPSQKISVIVPSNPFTRNAPGRHCICTMDVVKLMKWWPGDPHKPERDAQKVKAIQRSLDWKRVAQIASYLLQKEITDAPQKINKYFSPIYEPKKNEPGRQWPPKISNVIGFQRAVYPILSNVLIHVNGATIEPVSVEGLSQEGAGELQFDEDDPNLNFSVIDGQHRINGAYLAICIKGELEPNLKLEMPANVFLDLDAINSPPVRQAAIFIDVNFYQKKVDRSLVADLFPTARGKRSAEDFKERAQDIGRKLMLEVGPLVGMIQIPGIKYGVKDVITLATLNGAVENILEILEKNQIESLEYQTEFLVQVLEGWANATGTSKESGEDDDSATTIAYQSRILVSVFTLVPALIYKLRNSRIIKLVSERASVIIFDQLKLIAANAGLIKNGKFLSKEEFKAKQYVGSGGIARFRDSLWAAFDSNKKLDPKWTADKIAQIAADKRTQVYKSIKK
jgi:DGQHR domain-containing protein